MFGDYTAHTTPFEDDDRMMVLKDPDYRLHVDIGRDRGKTGLHEVTDKVAWPVPHGFWRFAGTRWP